MKVFFLAFAFFLLAVYLLILLFAYKYPALINLLFHVNQPIENSDIILGNLVYSIFFIIVAIFFLLISLLSRNLKFRKILDISISIIFLCFLSLNYISFAHIKNHSSTSRKNQISHKKIKTNRELFTKELKENDYGQDVLILQYILSNEVKTYPKALITGYFGKITKENLQKLQSKYKLSPSGFLDEDTRKKLNALYGHHKKDYYLSKIKNLLQNQARKKSETISKNRNIDLEWGIAKQISEKTWTIKVGFDPKMANAKEIFEALNNYRETHGRNKLQWDERLANFALTRAKYFTKIGSLDEHKGFKEYVNNIENLKKLGFMKLGENSSYGYRLEAVHLIEWVFAADKPHDENQLSPEWTHVGIGVDRYQVDIIFGAYPF